MKPSSDPAKLVVTTEFITIIKKVLEVFNGNIFKTREWMIQGNLNLGGFPPLKLYMMGKGEKVLDFIEDAKNFRDEPSPREWEIYFDGSVMQCYQQVHDGTQLMMTGEKVKVREVL